MRCLPIFRGRTGIATSFDNLGRAQVRLGDASGPLLVDGTASATLAVSSDAAGRIAFTLDGAAVAPTSGALAGAQQSLDRIATLRTELDGVATNLITLANNAQSAGVTPAGTTGAALFSGTGAGDIALALGSGAGLATAPAGSGTNSRDTGNLASLRTALAANTGPTKGTDTAIFALSAEISGRAITGEALEGIALSAAAALAAETAVDLDQEAADLIRFQQAYQASGRVIQTANTLFDTLLAIR